MELERIESLNDDPAFIRGLAVLVERPFSTLRMRPGEIVAENVARRFRVYPRRNADAEGSDLRPAVRPRRGHLGAA